MLNRSFRKIWLWWLGSWLKFFSKQIIEGCWLVCPCCAWRLRCSSRMLLLMLVLSFYFWLVGFWYLIASTWRSTFIFSFLVLVLIKVLLFNWWLQLLQLFSKALFPRFNITETFYNHLLAKRHYFFFKYSFQLWLDLISKIIYDVCLEFSYVILQKFLHFIYNSSLDLVDLLCFHFLNAGLALLH